MGGGCERSKSRVKDKRDILSEGASPDHSQLQQQDGVKIAEWTSAKMICLKGMERWVLEFSLGES